MIFLIYFLTYFSDLRYKQIIHFHSKWNIYDNIFYRAVTFVSTKYVWM